MLPPGFAETAIAVVEEDAITLSRMVRSLESLPNVSPYNNVDDVLARRPSGFLQIALVLGPSQASELVLEQVGKIVRAEPGTGALLVVAAPDSSVLRSALRAGLDDAVPLDRMAEDLVPALRVLASRLYDATADLRQAAASAAEAARGRVASVFSPKGGVGRSVVAVNLAAAFAARTRRRVVLVDADPQFGDVSVMLRLNPLHTLADALEAGDRFDPTLCESLLTHDARTGIDVLAAPTDPTTPPSQSAKSISSVIRVLREMGALVVIDTPRSLDDVVLQVLSESDDIVYLVGTDVPSVKNARLGLQALELVQISINNVLIVLNKAESRVQLSSRDVEKVLEMRIDISLPNDALVAKSVNRGSPAVISRERSRFSAEMFVMAELLLARAAAEPTL